MKKIIKIQVAFLHDNHTEFDTFILKAEKNIKNNLQLQFSSHSNYNQYKIIGVELDLIDKQLKQSKRRYKINCIIDDIFSNLVHTLKTTDYLDFNNIVFNADILEYVQAL